MGTNRITHRICRWGLSVGLAGGALVPAAAVGIGAAHIDPPSSLEATATPVDLLATGVPILPPDFLDNTIANFTQANEVLNQIDLEPFPGVASFLHSQMSTQGLSLTTLNALPASEELISNNSSPLGALVDLWFYAVNVPWYLISEATLFLDQTAQTALANNLPEVAAIANAGLVLVDLGIFAASLNSFPVGFSTFFF